MSFLAPLMLAGLAGLLVPVIIHLIGRRRAKVVRFAALDFLLATRRRTARRLQLRERLLLAVRVLVCIAIPVAVARPFTSCASKGPLVARGPQAAVLVIDDSFTSGYRLDGKTLLARATDQAALILTQLGPEAEVAVVHTAAGSTNPTELSRDHLRLRDHLAGLSPSARPGDLDRALARANQLLAGSSHRRRTIYLLSALTRAGVGEPGAHPAGGPAIEVIDLRGTAALPNLAVTGLTVEADATAGTRGIAVVAEIANFSSLPAAGVPVALRVDGQVIAKGEIDLVPGEKRRKRFLATLPAGKRTAEVVVELPGDALPADDRRYAVAHLRDAIRVLLVDGDARAARHDDELFYLEAALRPGDRTDAGATVTKITPGDLDQVDLAQHDVVVLANVTALPAARVARLAAWVASGGGLLVAPGDHVDAAAYDRTMLPLLPQSLRDPIDTAWGAPDERAARALHLTKWQTDHPVFAPFASDAPGLADASFTKIALLGPTTDTEDRQVLARFTNGAAALVEARSGNGRLLLYTSTVDRDWNDLPIHPGYLPLFQETIRHLARRRDTRGDGAVTVGQSTALPVVDARKLEVRGPGGRSTVFEGERLDGRRTVRFTATGAAGIYRVTGTDGAGTTRERDELAFAVNLDARGSDLSPAAPSALPVAADAVDGARHPTRRRIELWHALAAALLVLLLAESLLIQRT